MKSTKEITNKILQIISDLIAIDKNLIKRKDTFSDDLGVDSLDMHVLFMNIEKEFKIKFDEDEVERIKTVEALIKMVIDKFPNIIQQEDAEIFEMHELNEENFRIA